MPLTARACGARIRLVCWRGLLADDQQATPAHQPDASAQGYLIFVEVSMKIK